MTEVAVLPAKAPETATREDEAPRPPAAAVPQPGRWGRIALIVAVVGWFALLVLAPTIALARAALGGGLVAFWTALTAPESVQAFRLTLSVTATATVLNTLFGLALALVLSRQRFRGRALVDGLVDLPFAVSPVIAGLMLIVMYGPATPLGSWLEHTFGIRVVYSWPAMVLATAFVTLPFVAREVVPVLKEFGRDQEEVAETLGAGAWTTFRRVTFPAIRWGLAYGVILTVARGLGEFGALLVVSGNILGRTQTATLMVHDAVESFESERAYAAALALAAVSFVLLLGIEAIRRRVAEREGRGG